MTLKTLTSLNKKDRPLFLCDNSIGVYPSVSSLSDYSIWRSWRLFYPCDHSIWSIWAHCPQILLSLRKNGQEESRLLNLRRLRSSRDPLGFLDIIREEKGTQTQTFGSGYPPVGWGFSTWRGGGRKVRYVPRNQGNQTLLAGYPRILPGYPGGAQKVWEKKVCVQFSFPTLVLLPGSMRVHTHTNSMICPRYQNDYMQLFLFSEIHFLKITSTLTFLNP